MIEAIQNKKAFLCDMDGVLYNGGTIIPGVDKFVKWLKENNKDYLFLTNSSGRKPSDLSKKLKGMGIDVGEEHFYTSAMATAAFINSQIKNASAYIIGQPGFIEILTNSGITINDRDPDYVIFGTSKSISYDDYKRAVKLVCNGSMLIGANPDAFDPSDDGPAPACGSLISPIEVASGKNAYFIGKPNSFMIRNALKKIGRHREDAIIIGDRMDTDIVMGVESEIDTILVLSGASSPETISKFPFRPTYIMNNVGEIVS